MPEQGVRARADHPQRVVVVDRDPEFVKGATRVLKQRGFEILGTADNASQARQLLQSGWCDLLITALIVDDPTADSEMPAGIQLAYQQHSQGGARVIFLCDGNESDESVEGAAACQPLAWIQRTPGEMTKRESLSLRASLEHFLQLRDLTHEHAEFASVLEELGSALLFLDVASGEIVDANSIARTLLKQSLSELLGRPWWQVLGEADSRSSEIGQALATSAAATLRPFCVPLPDGDELLVEGRTVPVRHRERNALCVCLRDVLRIDDIEVAQQVRPGDTAAILGVSQLRFDETWGAADTPRLMMEVHAGLQEIVRNQDYVALPEATSVRLVLRDIDAQAAVDMSRALLSHLQPISRGRGAGGSEVLISIGLAEATAERSGLQALVDANDALVYAQQSQTEGRIEVASPEHRRLLCASALFGHGGFEPIRSTPAYHEFLRQLSEVTPNDIEAEVYIDAMMSLLLAQKAVRGIALYRRRYREAFEFVVARDADGGIAEADLDDAFTNMRNKVKPRLFNSQQEFRVPQSGVTLYSLNYGGNMLGYLLLDLDRETAPGVARFVLDVSAQHQMARALAHYPAWRHNFEHEPPEPGPVHRPVETTIQGYVVDNMEGAVDQALFLARLDIPVAVIGAKGTGKMYVARIIHGETGADEDKLLGIDCRELKGREEANQRIARELKDSAGKTLVFKSPHLMHPEVQARLARQLATRVVADSKPPQYLPKAKYVALFPEPLDHLVRLRGLNERLAGVFAGYPIVVPPIKDRKQAVLRWAHKILTQECADRGRVIKGFTPDAEQALLQHEWPGNISEMRSCINAALNNSDKEWLTPVDLGLFTGISAEGTSAAPEQKPYLARLEDEAEDEGAYTPSALEALDTALGLALADMLRARLVKPLGTWLDDELVLAACERYRGDARRAAEFLQTPPRNIGRWMPKINSREDERANSALWREPRRLVLDWVRAVQPPEVPPLQMLQELLMAHVANQCAGETIGTRANIMGVSTPTYQKRMQQLLSDQNSREMA